MGNGGQGLGPLRSVVPGRLDQAHAGHALDGAQHVYAASKAPPAVAGQFHEAAAGKSVFLAKGRGITAETAAIDLEPQQLQPVLEPQHRQVATVPGKMAALPGLVWKLWTSQAAENRAAGFYLFATRNDAEHRLAWAQKHFPKVPGLTNVQGQIFDVMEDLTRVTRGPIDLPANPSL